jgi:hypothetical protein
LQQHGREDFHPARAANDRSWHETAALCVPTNVCSWGKSGRAADITAMTEFDPICDISAQFLL